MTEHNHRRGTAGVMYEYRGGRSHNGYGLTPNVHRAFPDKSMQGWGDYGELSGVRIGASIGNDFSNGNRGMAKAARGAKKYVRSRIRFHENQAARALSRQVPDKV